MPIPDALLTSVGALARNEAVRQGAQQVLQAVYERMARRAEQPRPVNAAAPAATPAVTREDLLEAIAATQVQLEASVRQAQAAALLDLRAALRPVYLLAGLLLASQTALVLLLLFRQ